MGRLIELMEMGLPQAKADVASLKLDEVIVKNTFLTMRHRDCSGRGPHTGCAWRSPAWPTATLVILGGASS